MLWSFLLDEGQYWELLLTSLGFSTSVKQQLTLAEAQGANHDRWGVEELAAFFWPEPNLFCELGWCFRPWSAPETTFGSQETPF